MHNTIQHNVFWWETLKHFGQEESEKAPVI